MRKRRRSTAASPLLPHSPTPHAAVLSRSTPRPSHHPRHSHPPRSPRPSSSSPSSCPSSPSPSSSPSSCPCPCPRRSLAAAAMPHGTRGGACCSSQVPHTPQCPLPRTMRRMKKRRMKTRRRKRTRRTMRTRGRSAVAASACRAGRACPAGSCGAACTPRLHPRSSRARLRGGAGERERERERKKKKRSRSNTKERKKKRATQHQVTCNGTTEKKKTLPFPKNTLHNKTAQLTHHSHHHQRQQGHCSRRSGRPCSTPATRAAARRA